MNTNLNRIPKFKEALDLAEEKRYEESYEMICSILDEKYNLTQEETKDILYTRAFLDFLHLNNHLESTIEDFKYLVDTKSKYRKVTCGPLALLFEYVDEYDQTIYYGELALKYKTFLQNQLYFSLARAYHYSQERKNLDKALQYIDLCMSNLDENENDFLQENCERIRIICSLHRFEEAQEEMNKFMIKYGNCKFYYQIYADYLTERYLYDKEDESLLNQAIEHAKMAYQYDEKDDASLLNIVNLYKLKKDYKNVIKYLEKITQKDNYIFINIIKAYEILEEYQKGIEVIDKIIETNPHWRFYYAKGIFKDYLDEKEEALECFMQAYYKCDEDKVNILYEIIEFNRAMHDDIKTYFFLKEEANKENNGIIYYLLGRIGLRIGAKYDEIIGYFREAYEKKAISYIEYLDSICDYVENDKAICKDIKRYQKLKFDYLPYMSKRKMAIRYMYGENGVKQNLNKALRMFIACKEETPDDSCDNALLGRCFELLGKNDLAFEQYQKAYDLIKDANMPHCDCPYGYYAHAMIHGIGVEKNEKLAKEIILDAVHKMGKYTTSHVVFYYSYFALQNDERFNKETALQLLEFDFPFYLKDISRIIYLQHIARSLNKESSKLRELVENLTKKYDRDELKYYNENVEKEYALPYWKTI